MNTPSNENTAAAARRSRQLTVSKLLALGATLAVAVSSVGATADATGETVQLPDYEAVATPLATQPTADRYAGAVTTIGEQQLRDLAPLDFASALRRSPGVTITRYNQVGAFGGSEGGAVYLRGLGASRPGGEIKTTFDGVPKLNGLFNHPLLDLLSLDAAASIQVHHRATPLTFGNAFGVVNIETPRVAAAGERARASAAAGSFGTFTESVAYGAKHGATDYYFAQGYRVSDGARADADGRLSNWFFRVGQDLNAHWNLSYRVNHGDNVTTDPGALGAPATKGETYATKDWLHLAVLEWNYERTSGSIRAYLNDGEGIWTRRQFSGNSDSLNDWRLHGVRWRQTAQLWEGGEVLAGADVDVERGTSVSVPLTGSSVTFGPGTTRLFSPYAGLSQQWRVGEVSVTPSVGARYYQHDTLGSEWSPQAGLVVVSGPTEWRAGYSRAVNFPGLEVRALSTFIPPLGTSWQKLSAEKAEQWELAVRHDFGAAVASVTLFRNAVSNRYVIAFPPPPPPRYTNVGAYRSQGAELSVEAPLGARAKLFAGLTLLDTDTGTVPYTPAQSWVGGVNWSPAAGWQVSVDAAYVSRMHVAGLGRSVGATNPVEVGAQFALNARLARRFALGAGGRTRLEVFLAAENLTDRDFAYTPGYPIPGVNGMIGVRLEH